MNTSITSNHNPRSRMIGVRKIAAAIAIIAATGLCAGGTALAYHHGGYHGGYHGGWHGDWHGGYHHYGYYHGPDYYYAPVPDYYYAPDPYEYYPPQPDYYPPPPNGINMFFGL